MESRDEYPTEEQVNETVRRMMGPQYEALPKIVRVNREHQLATIVRAAWKHILDVDSEARVDQEVT